MVRVDLVDPIRTPPLPASSVWRLHLGLLGTARRRLGLLRFSAWCHLRGIGPFEVSQETLDAFENYVRTRLLRKHIRQFMSDVARFWNQAAQTIPVWPQTILHSPRRRRPYTLPFSAYSDGVQSGIKSFASRLERSGGHGPFKGDGPPRTLRPSTIKARLFSLRQALAALVLMGRDPGTIADLSALVEEDAFKAILTFYWRRAINLRVARGDLDGNSDPPPEEGVTEQTAAIGSALLMVANRDRACYPRCAAIRRAKTWT